MARIACLIVCTAVISAGFCLADSSSSNADNHPSRPAASGAKAREQTRWPALTVAREAAALAFVGQHHPELVDLLRKLKESNKDEYAKVVRELFQTSERLAGVQERNPERYELEVEQGKLKSRIQLLAARVSMTQSETLEEELRDALKQQAKLRLELLSLERRQLRQRLDRVEASITEFERNQDQLLQKQFDQLTGAAKRSRSEKLRAKQARAKANREKTEAASQDRDK